MLSLICHNSWMISSGIVKHSHQFLRSTNLRAVIAMGGANVSYDRFGFGIIEMSIVSRQEIVYTMHGGDCNMKRIIQGFGR